MHKTLCIDCQYHRRRKHSPLRQSCFDERMKSEYRDIRVDVQANKYF